MLARGVLFCLHPFLENGQTSTRSFDSVVVVGGGEREDVTQCLHLSSHQNILIIGKAQTPK